MEINENLILETLQKLSSPILAFSCSKTKSEKHILTHLAYHMEQQLKTEENDGWCTNIEYPYKHLIQKSLSLLKGKRADLAIVDKKCPDKCYAVFEAKLSYSFDCYTTYFEKMKDAIAKDLRRLLKINNVMVQNEIINVKKFFLQFLVHYQANEVPNCISAYGTTHNREMENNFKDNSEMLDKAEQKLISYIEELKRKYDVKALKPLRITLGSYMDINVILSVIVIYTDK